MPRCGQIMVTPVRTTAGLSRIRVEWPTSTPPTSVMAFRGPVGSRPSVMPRSRSRARAMFFPILRSEFRPTGLGGCEPRRPAGQGTLAQRLQADKGQAQCAVGAAHFAGFLVAKQQRRAEGWHGALDDNRHQALAHQAAIARTRRQLLTQIAPLIPVDGVEFVE